jgi:hypothetical protein
VALTGHVPEWVRDAFVRCAREHRRTVSSPVAEILIEDCQDDVENPKNQARGVTPFVTEDVVSTMGTSTQPHVDQMPDEGV